MLYRICLILDIYYVCLLNDLMVYIYLCMLSIWEKQVLENVCQVNEQLSIWIIDRRRDEEIGGFFKDIEIRRLVVGEISREYERGVQIYYLLYYFRSLSIMKCIGLKIGELCQIIVQFLEFQRKEGKLENSNMRKLVIREICL